MPRDDNPLELFHPVVRAWFEERFGAPTEAQRLAWPRIAAGEHVLLTAPTGSGKTLAAFLAALDRLLTGAWPLGAVRVLYVSPLKALNTDVRRNLLGPLEEIRERWRVSEPSAPPEIGVLTRSGDTPAEERQRMARRPPEILITTPESLNILLTSRRGRAMLGGVATVILDEVHAVVGGKRGTHLITAVERLVGLAGELQRIALSATVRPLERVAGFVGGFERVGEGSDASYHRRPVAIVRADAAKRYDIRVRFPAGGEPIAEPGTASAAAWARVVEEIRGRLAANRSTLVFANSRRMVEKLARLVNEGEREQLVYSHHGSLAREIRAVVEERLKAGELRGLVATSSLELGIDVGALDEVVLVQTPPQVVSAVQRIGRAGHAVGETSRALFLPLHPRDLLDAAVVARAVEEGAIEPVRPVVGPLDVLAQVIVSMTANQTWAIDELFAAVRTADPYQALSRRQLDLVLEMLAGRWAAIRLRELAPLVSIDRVEGTVRGRSGAERVVYAAGGTIPDRGYFHLREADSGALLGELDEEFVWERAVGDTFTLGVQSWRIERVTHNDVLVRPTRVHAAMAPFWRAEERDRSFELSERIGAFLADAGERLGSPAFARELETTYRLDRPAAASLISYLEGQRSATGGHLPHRHLLVVERVSDPLGKGEGEQVILHTGWGGRVNRPFSLALAAAWEERHGVPLEVMHDNDCIAISNAPGARAVELVALVQPGDLERLLRARLETSGFFGARFREAAGVALLLPREGFRRRTPLWLSRQRAKDLLAATRGGGEFPLVLEAWRSCLQDAFDLDALRRVLEELADGRTAVREVVTDHPSPFAASVSWKRTNELMYEDDAQAGAGASKLRGDLLREVAFSSELRPRIAPALAETLRRKLQRTAPGYAPRTTAELVDWVVERAVIPPAEWGELLDAIARDGHDAAAMQGGCAGSIAMVHLSGTGASFVAAIGELPRVLVAIGVGAEEVELASAADGGPIPAVRAALASALARAAEGEAPDAEADALAELLAEVLRFQAVVPLARVPALLGLDAEAGRAALDVLADAGRVVVDRLLEGSDELEVCDTENLERLLRLTRAEARPRLEPLPLDRLPAFLASWQGLAIGHSLDDLRAAMERLLGYAAPAEVWEAEILPARLEPYFPSWLDTLLAETELGWFGCGDERIAFALEPERDLFVAAAPADETAESSDERADLMPAGPGRFTFEELLAHSRLPSAELSRRLWAAAWKGEVGNDGFAALRQGIASRFKPAEVGARRVGGRVARRASFDRWKGSRPFAGSWCRLASPPPPADAVEAEERNKERARVLLDRYGVLFRELFERELPEMQWGRLFRTLRLMELGGEVVTGQLFAGIGGIQFASHAAVRALQRGIAEDRTVWMSALDPASPCGLGLPFSASLPRRVAGSHVVLRGNRVVAVSERRGKALGVQLSADHPDLPEVLGFLKVLLTREARPMRSIAVETINGAPAAASPYRAALERLFHVTRDRTGLRLMKKY